MADAADDQSQMVESEPALEASTSQAKGVKQERGRSSIEWPYFGLDEAIKLARVVFEIGGRCSVEQLSGEVHSTVTSGAFRLKVQATKTFGLLQTEQAVLTLTDLGGEVLEADSAADAKARAFLRVPLYNLLYETYKGKSLPPNNAALESSLVHLGVAVKQRDKARQAFQRSAKEAGFFAYGATKLIYPVIANRSRAEKPPVPEVAEAKVNTTSHTRSYEVEETELHPFVRGLLKTLPEPGGDWPIEGRRKWLQSALSIFDLIYENSDENQSIAISVAKTSER